MLDLLVEVLHPRRTVEYFKPFFIDRDTLMSFYYRALRHQTSIADKGYGPLRYTYYEFGVGWGGTLTTYIQALKIFCGRRRKTSTHIIYLDLIVLRDCLSRKVEMMDSLSGIKSITHIVFQR